MMFFPMLFWFYPRYCFEFNSQVFLDSLCWISASVIFYLSCLTNLKPTGLTLRKMTSFWVQLMFLHALSQVEHGWQKIHRSDVATSWDITFRRSRVQLSPSSADCSPRHLLRSGSTRVTDFTIISFSFQLISVLQIGIFS